MVHTNVPRRRLIFGVALFVASLILAACQSDEAPSVQEVGPPAIDRKSGGQTAVTTPEASQNTKPGAAATATGSANIEVSPSEVPLGSVMLGLTVQPAQSIYDPARVQPGPAQGDQKKDSPQLNGYAVLGGSSLKVTNNFDPAQGAPADQPQEMVRHVALQIKDKESGQLIPHVSVNVDLLRDGRSVLQDQPLVPMVEAGGGVAQMHYGNNVKFPGRGEYQVFVRMEPSPLLGSGSTGVAQFNISIR